MGKSGLGPGIFWSRRVLLLKISEKLFCDKLFIRDELLDIFFTLLSLCLRSIAVIFYKLVLLYKINYIIVEKVLWLTKYQFL